MSSNSNIVNLNSKRPTKDQECDLSWELSCEADCNCGGRDLYCSTHETFVDDGKDVCPYDTSSIAHKPARAA